MLERRRRPRRTRGRGCFPRLLGDSDGRWRGPPGAARASGRGGRLRTRTSRRADGWRRPGRAPRRAAWCPGRPARRSPPRPAPGWWGCRANAWPRPSGTRATLGRRLPSHHHFARTAWRRALQVQVRGGARARPAPRRAGAHDHRRGVARTHRTDGLHRPGPPATPREKWRCRPERRHRQVLSTRRHRLPAPWPTPR